MFAPGAELGKIQRGIQQHTAAGGKVGKNVVHRFGFYARARARVIISCIIYILYYSGRIFLRGGCAYFCGGTPHIFAPPANFCGANVCRARSQRGYAPLPAGASVHTVNYLDLDVLQLLQVLEPALHGAGFGIVQLLKVAVGGVAVAGYTGKRRNLGV